MYVIRPRPYPLGLVVEAGGGVQRHHLVVLHGEVRPRALQVVGVQVESNFETKRLESTVISRS